jgi:hypothetical protein
MILPVLQKTRSSFLLTLLCLFTTTFILTSCVTKAKFANSTVVPAAEGEVKVKKDDNNNYKVEVAVQNLADPKRLPQPRTVYLVWAETANGNPQNLGQLRSSSGIFSSKLKAELETITPYKPTRIFITAEDVATVVYPSSYVILNTNVF